MEKLNHKGPASPRSAGMEQLSAGPRLPTQNPDVWPLRNRVYLLPGRGNRLDELGEIILALGYDVLGRGLVPPFSLLRFPEQLAVVKDDLLMNFWHADAKLVGHSYGGYIILHALTELDPFPGRILLLSPVLGTAFRKDRLSFSRPPRGEALLRLAESGAFPAMRHLEILTGENDDGCDPSLAANIGSLVPHAETTVIRGQAHTLSPEVVREALARFLGPGAYRGSAEMM